VEKPGGAGGNEREPSIYAEIQWQNVFGVDLSRDNLDENGGGNQSLKRRPVAEL
jgi:hypothetical protein